MQKRWITASLTWKVLGLIFILWLLYLQLWGDETQAIAVALFIVGYMARWIETAVDKYIQRKIDNA